MVKQVFLDGVLIESGDGAQPPSDSGPGPAAGIQVPGEALDVGAADLEQEQVTLLVPGRVLARVQRVRLAGQAGVTGLEPCQREPERLALPPP
jgi:hypothetical protein